jgi:hypothetical protein
MIQKTIVLLVFIVAHSVFHAQVKKNLLGTYAGQISSYTLNTGLQSFKVEAVLIEVKISSDSLSVQIGNTTVKGTYEILLDKPNYYVLVGKMENQLADERIILYKKGKKISREGIQPQPDALLEKKKK